MHLRKAFDTASSVSDTMVYQDHTNLAIARDNPTLSYQEWSASPIGNGQTVMSGAAAAADRQVTHDAPLCVANEHTILTATFSSDFHDDDLGASSDDDNDASHSALGHSSYSMIASDSSIPAGYMLSAEVSPSPLLTATASTQG